MDPYKIPYLEFDASFRTFYHIFIVQDRKKRTSFNKAVCYCYTIYTVPAFANNFMIMSSLDNIWPSQRVPEPVKQLIKKFFSIVDSKSHTSGEQLADSVFSSEGQMKNGAKVFSGRDGK